MKRLFPWLTIVAVAAALVAVMTLTLSGPPPGPGPGPAPRVPPPPAAHDPAALPGGPVGSGAPAADDPDAFRGGLAGRVTRRDTGDPVAGAGVEAWLGRWRGKATTGADGRYSIGGVPPGGVRLRVSSARYVDPPLKGVAVTPGETAVADFELEVGVDVAGRVVDAETGEGIGGATVTVTGSGSKKVEGGPDGAYRIPGLGPGNVVLGAVAPGYPQVRIVVRVGVGSLPVHRDIPMTRGAVVRGVVVDSSDHPVAGAAVALRGFPPSTAESAADGRFELPAVPVERTVWVTAEKDGYVPARSSELRFRSGEEYSALRLVLNRGGTVRGRVFFADGTPARGARLWLLPKNIRGFMTSPPRAVADLDGRFTLAPVAPGDHQLVASHASGIEVRMDVPGVTEGGVVGGLEVRLGLAQGISGVVRDDNGGGLPGVIVQARPLEPGPGARWGSARTDAEGRFALRGLAPGSYDLTARQVRGGGSVQMAGVATGTQDLVLTLPAPGTISGVVVYRSGEPAKSYTIRARRTPAGSETAAGSLFERVNSKDGTFRIDGVAPGTWTFSANARDGYSEPVPDVVVTAGGVTGDLRVVLDPPAAISGRVVDQDGRVASGIRVTAYGGRAGFGASGASAVTDGSGAFRLGPLRPGSYRVVAARGGLVTSLPEVEAGAGADTSLTLTLPATGGIRVVVTDGEGSPVAGAYVHLRTAAGAWIPIAEPDLPEDMPPDRRAAAERTSRQSAIRTDDAGRCERRGVPEGETSIRVMAPGYGDADATAVVPAGDTVEVRVRLSPGTSSMDRKTR